MKTLAAKIRPYAGCIVAGGPHISALPSSLEGCVDAVITGYGEEGILKVIQGKRGRIHESVDINKFPLPNRVKLNFENYKLFTDELETATMITSRGCPHKCAFCASHERKVQFREPENVREEIQQLKLQGYQAVYILDENFGIKKNHLMKITDIFRKEKMRYRMEMRSRDVTEEVSKRLKETGCMYVSLGCESGDNKILKKTETGKTVEENKNAIQILNKYNIPVKGFFIIGLPGETNETARKTIEFSEEMRYQGLKHADFYTLTPFPGNAIWNNPEKYGIKILSKNFDAYLQKGCPLIETEHLSQKRIKELLEEARTRWKK
jgi:radical SAM superfamily enzyme YgiQ (UPF0313 family)